VFLVYWCIQSSLSQPTGKILAVLSQEIGVGTLHTSSHCPTSHSAKCDEHNSCRQQSHDNTAIETCWRCVKTCNPVSNTSTISWTARYTECSLSTFCTVPSPPNLSRNRVTVTRVGGCFKIHFSNVFAPHSHSTFQATLKNAFTFLKCQTRFCHFVSCWLEPSSRVY
jgi:hypothetical protein